MPATIPVAGEEVPLFIVGINNNANPPQYGVQLPTGATVTIVSADPNTVTFTPDATPGMSPANPNATPPVPAYQSVLSGEVVSPAAPAQLGVPITLTMTLTLNGVAQPPVTDTVTVSPDVATAIGDIFGVPVAVPGPAPLSVKKR